MQNIHFCRKALSSIFFLFVCLGAMADDFSSIHISSDDGLTQNNVKSIVQDAKGFMWFGTKNGLNRYDGYRLVQFYVKDEVEGCGNQNVSALYCSADGRLWVGTDEGVYTFDSSRNLFTRLTAKASNGKSIKGWISSIGEAPDGTMWFCVGGQGIFSYNPPSAAKGEKAKASSNGGRLVHYFAGVEGDRAPVYLTCCTDGSVWACSWNNGLYRFDEQHSTFRNIRTDAQGATLCDLQANTVAQQGSDLIIGTQNGRVMRYNMRTGTLRPITLQYFGDDIVRNAMVYGDEIWVGTYNGLYIVNEKLGTTQHLTHQTFPTGMLGRRLEANGDLLADNLIYCTYRDRDGGTWVGTMFGGVNYLSMRSQTFRGIYTDAFGNSFNGYNIRSIIEDEAHRLWINTEDGGVSTYDLKSHAISAIARFTTNEGVPLSLAFTPEGVACTLNKNKVAFFDPNGAKGVRHTSTLAAYGIQGTNSIYELIFDAQGRCWLATDVGAYCMERGATEARLIKEINYNWIYDIAVDQSGNIWFASMGGGVYRRDGHTGKVQRFTHVEQNPHSLSSNSVSSITIDHKGNVWFSTDRGGICRYNARSNDFTRYSIEEGLPDNVAYKIVEDNDGILWFGTNRGLVRLNPTQGDIRVFTTRDGLPSNQFNYKGALLASDGRIYMATINGLLTFSPRLGNMGRDVKDIFFTNLAIAGQYCQPGAPGSPLTSDIMEMQRIVLPYDKTNITLDISALVYASQLTDSYEYRLLPVDGEWHSTGPTSSISYANLAPGHYTLCIRMPQSLDSDSYIQRELTIVVSPPWWRSIFAYILYAVALFGGTVLVFLRYRRRKEQEFLERQKLFTIEKEKELYKNKVDFFTQVAHEVRTPLTLINGPMEIIRGMNVGDEHLRKNLSVIDQNTRRLLFLTSQLLDFQKVESATHFLTFERVNLTDLISETVERFEPAFTVAGKTLRIDDSDDVETLADREGITKILSNLFNNARKYALHAATVSVRNAGTTVMLRVVSDGERIPAAKAETIFEPFVRLDGDQRVQQPGTGIGLPLARSLAQMHGGKLYLDTTDTTGNVFVLTLPVQSARDEDQHLTQAVAPPDRPIFVEQPKLSDAQARGNTLLIVEDEEGIRNFLAERLSQDFVVETASQGEEALQVMEHGHIDLVISDIMMPVMDGLELCRRIKDNTAMSHTPVVFLTAKNDTDAKIEGLKAGAEAYIEKPFSYDYLYTQITSLLDNRVKEREAFSKRPFFPTSDMRMSREDEEMTQRIVDVINENIRDEEFNVERLADIMCMSRSSLLRKIKQLFNMTPLEFIRVVRLKRAAELIHEGKYRMAEIGYMVGFGNPSYFAKMFCRQFGVTPKDFEQQLKAQRESEKGKSD